MGRARKDEMREANHSHAKHLMRGGRPSSGSSEELPSPRGREREEERRRDLNRDRDRDRPRDSMASFAGAGRLTSVLPTGEELTSAERVAARRARFATAGGGGGGSGAAAAPRPVASAASDPLSTDRVATRQSRFGTGAPTGGGASGAAAAPRPVVAPRPARSPSPDLREVAADHFIENHLHRAESPTSLATRGRQEAVRRGKTNTMISLDHKGRKQLYHELKSDPIQTAFKGPLAGRTVGIEKLRGSSMTFDKHGNLTKQKLPIKERNLSIRGYGTDKTPGLGEHLESYESD